MLDDVFGLDNFQSEIIWTYKRWSNSKKGLLNDHQTIFFYSKTKEFKFNKLFTNYSTTTNLAQILQARKRDENEKKFLFKRRKREDSKCFKKSRSAFSRCLRNPFLKSKSKRKS